MGEPEETVKLSVRIPKELHRRLRVMQAYDGRSTQEILVRMIEALVRKDEERRDA